MLYMYMYMYTCLHCDAIHTVIQMYMYTCPFSNHPTTFHARIRTCTHVHDSVNISRVSF